MKEYIQPSDVHAPRRHWSLIQVLFDGGEEESALAIGRWDNKPVLAMRWNGTKDNPLGNPQSRGLPTWFVVPEQYWRQILQTPPFNAIHADTVELARKFLELEREYFLTQCPNPQCRNYRGLVLLIFAMPEVRARLDELERDELKFYHIICDHSWTPGPQEKAEAVEVLRAAWQHYCLRSAPAEIQHAK